MRAILGRRTRPTTLPKTALAGACLALTVALGGCGADEPATDESAETPAGSTPSPSDDAGEPAESVLSDEDAVRAFYDAVVAGDRAAATEVATDAAVGFFDPYEPHPDYTLSGPDGGIFFISPGAAPFQCTVADGLVQDCLDEPTGDTGLSDAEAARAFFDAVVAGDRDAAEAVATDRAVAFFQPYEPRPDYTFSGPDNGIFFISPGAAPFQCTVGDGEVQECLDEPTGEE